MTDPSSPSGRVNRRRVLQTVVLVIGMVAIAVTVVETVKDTHEHVLPSPIALALGGLLCLATITASARAWSALFRDIVDVRANRLILHGTVYLSQLTKYLPAGGAVQAASQLSLARLAGVSLRRAAVAFPVSAVGAVVAGATLGSGLVFDTELPGWVRALALLGLGTVVFLHRGLMAWVLDCARHLVHRIPSSDELPTQSDIFAMYGWMLVTTGSLSIAYTILLRSVTHAASPFTVFCAFAMSWVVGFVAVPIPAGVGVREAVLVALLPGIGTAPLLAASLALRLLSIGAEVLALMGNKVATRRHTRPSSSESRAGELQTP